MRYYLKWYLMLLFFYAGLNFLASCSPNYRYRRMLKRRKAATVQRHKSTHQRKIRRRTIPINKNYVIRHQRTRAPRGPYR